MNSSTGKPARSDAPLPQPLPQVDVIPEVLDPASTASTPALAPVGKRYIWLMVLAQFGVFVAFITPLAISLAIRLNELAPGREEYLGYITGAGAFAVMLTSPFLGVASDRTRTRLGRRRPFMIGGMILGIVSLVVMATAPSVLVLGTGWVLAQLGWGTVLSNLLISTADRLPESQRGKVAGLTGFATQVAPVVGVVLAGSFASNNLLLFLVPGAVGVLLTSLFVLLVHEKDSRGNTFDEKLNLGRLLRKYLYNPKQHPDFSWNWLGRFFFYFGLTLNTTFTAFFFASRLGVSVTEVAGILAILSMAGILATTAGAIGGGFLSDKLRRRRAFVCASGLIFGAGAIIMALSSDMPMLVAGSLLGSLGIGMFSAVDQALLLDVLPERETDAGRFMGIISFATSIPQSIAPLIAPIFLAVGVTAGGEKNYLLLYVIAAACTVLGGLVVLRIRSVR
ncbi:MFS transporter [Arthrobacter sp. Sa2CUA1]|uniref:MFS transporter n=1 Tax=Arthrobacter gallicola TaxID=2762225 RepID=A0ABR8UVY9_9MICC|nr:MFS transporter [Arthrobacter gallicola]MBD7996713.1 MFS transporter [Arthrobacter gallicola]